MDRSEGAGGPGTVGEIDRPVPRHRISRGTAHRAGTTSRKLFTNTINQLTLRAQYRIRTQRPGTYMANVTLTGDYGYKEYWVRNAASGMTVDATTADWHIAAKETVPAINIYNSVGVVINGGEIWGEVSQTANWTDIYNHMSTGFRISNSPNTTIRNVRIDGTWDGIRFIPDSLNVANGNSNGWLVEDAHLSNIRDDAIENDFAATGTCATVCSMACSAPSGRSATSRRTAS